MSQLIDKLKKLGASSLEIEAIIYSDDINKSLSEFYKKSLEEDLFKAKAAVGEIREWKGIKYQKQADGSWKLAKGQKRTKVYAYKELKEFGTNYSSFEGKPKQAIDFLLKEKKGQVIGAWERRGLGKIDIVWGDDIKGIRHIRKRHFIEQDDFESLEEMSDIISDVLKHGRIGNFYENNSKVNIHKDKYRVVLMRTVVYDEKDNFRDKIWVLTSFDYSRPKEDKIRKSSIVLNGPDDSNDMDSARHNPFISSIAFSERKDTLKKSLEQHLMKTFSQQKDNILS